MAARRSRPILPTAGVNEKVGRGLSFGPRWRSEWAERMKGIEAVIKATTGYVAATLLAGAAFGFFGGAAHAAQPEPWQIGFQPAATPIMEMVHHFNNGLLVVVTLIMLLVLGLLLYCMIRFNARSNPVPSRTSHNTLVEVVWTVLPILILVGIAVPSFALLFAEHDPARAIPGYDPAVDAHMTIKATGNQWYWTYEYPDSDGFSFDSLMLTEEERAARPDAGPRLLAVDNQLVVPTDTVITMQVIGADVIHSFAVPAFGIKIDAVPGRLNETWFKVTHEGVYFGQCSELCGRDHAFMPIAVRAVSPEKFNEWIAAAPADLSAAYGMLAEAGTAATTETLMAGE
jgi:cytochrome c oxidase subunit II